MTFATGGNAFALRSPFAPAPPPGAPNGTASATSTQRPARLVKTGARHLAKLQAARDAVATLPHAEGESAHWLLLGFFDPIHLIAAALERYGACTHLRLATLSLSKRNVDLFCGMLDTSAVARLSVLTSTYQYRMDADIYDHLQAELTTRGQQVGAIVNHAKLALFDMTDGRKFVMEGSANLRSCRSVEQVALHCSGELHDWYAAWFDEALATTAALNKEQLDALPDGAATNDDEDD